MSSMAKMLFRHLKPTTHTSNLKVRNITCPSKRGFLRVPSIRPCPGCTPGSGIPRTRHRDRRSRQSVSALYVRQREPAHESRTRQHRPDPFGSRRHDAPRRGTNPPVVNYDFSTVSSFFTENTPGTPFATIPALSLSPWFATAPTSVTLPFFTTM